MMNRYYPSRLSRLISCLVILSLFLGYMPTWAADPSFASALTSETFTTAENLAASRAQSVADSPLILSRVQSSYTTGLTTISFTASNNLPPTLLPEIPDTATYTETIGMLASFSSADDVNTLHQVVLEDSLAPGTALVAASGNPVISGGNLSWTLSDLPPLSSVTITMTVQTPAAGADFINLDSGAQLSALRWGEPVSTGASPAVIVPAGIPADTTQVSPAVDIYDADMLWQSARLGQEPLGLFELVRGFGNDPYAGSLRGTRGTLWGEAGNAADKASLLIAMLRAAGVPARYRHGSLSTIQAQTLLESMFSPRTGMAGFLPEGTQTADPLDDASLLSLAADHWWVEAYLPGQGWTDLDPSFPQAQPGDSFAVPSGDASDRAAALPDALDYTVHLELLVEQYSAFPNGGVNLSSMLPISATFSLAELASKALTIGHIVVTESQGGVFSTITHTYTPFFALAGDDFLTLGSEFQDILTNFPLASNFTTAEWLNVTLTSPDGQEQTFTREIKDMIGLDARTFGGNLNLALPEDNRPFTSLDDAFAVWFLPNQLANTQYADSQQAANTFAVIEAAEVVNAVPNPLVTPADRQVWQQAILDYFLARNQQYAIAGLEFARLADPAVADIESNLRVKLFYDQPRIIITSSASQPDGTIETSIDLRTTQAQAVVYPGQSTRAEFTAQWIKGVIESYYETEIAARLAGAIPVSTARLFDELHTQGLLPVLITPETMDFLDLYYLDRQAVAYARQALLEGKHILIPPGPVLIDGKEVTGWWEFDLQTGETISLLENGQHTAALEYIAMLLEFWDALDDAGDLQEATAKMWTCIAESVVPALQGNPQAPANCLEGFKIPNTAWPPWYPDPLDYFAPRQAGLDSIQVTAPASVSTTSSWRYLPAYLCPVDNCGIEQFVLPYPAQSPIPLPDMLFGYNDRFGGEDLAGRQFSVTGSGGGAPAISLETIPASGSVLPGDSLIFELTAQANFSSELRAWVYAPAGWQVRFTELGQLEAAPRPGTLPGDYTLKIVSQAVDHPGLIATLDLPVSIPDANDLLLASVPEPQITVPSGEPDFEAVSNQTNDGEAEYPDSAYRLVIANFSGQSKSLTLSASGAPAGWIALNGARQTATTFELPANQRTQVGLYILPDANPAPGTAFTLEIQLSDGQGLVKNDSIPWSMPGQGHSSLELEPAVLYLGSTGSAEFSFSLENVGNTAAVFPLSAVLPPVNASLSGLPAPVSLAVAERQTFTVALNTTDIPVGTRFPVLLASPAPDSYTQYAQSMVQIVSPLTEPVFQAADQMANVCTIGEPRLSDALRTLALGMTRLEASCQSGVCSLPLRDQVVQAAESVVFYAGAISPSLTQDEVINQTAAQLAAHTSQSEILSDLAVMSAALASTGTTSLLGEVCALTWHNPSLGWTPAYSATLTGQPVQYALNLTNLGALPTTYALTLTLPSGVQTFNPLLDPGETASFPALLDLPATGLYHLDAEVSVQGDEWITGAASALLNVVDRYIQLTRVSPEPAFVETGSSSTTISVEVDNLANLALPSTTRTTILAPGGATAYTGDMPLTILAGGLRSYTLQTVDTSGWAAGTYTVTVELLNQSGTALIPDGGGYGYLGVGQALGISHAVHPQIVAPGTVTVTTVITSEILAPVIIPSPARSPDSGATQAVFSSPEPVAPVLLPPPALHTTDAITRTDDLDASLSYAGAWTPVTTAAWTRHAYQGSYTVSDTPGDTITFPFSGTWLHIGFATDRFGGQAEIFVDGDSLGIVDTYSREITVASYAYSGFADAAHTLTITVLGTAHPNASGEEVKLDYIDTWDGTLYPDGTVEQSSSRVWRSLDWGEVTDPDASGGSYMTNNINGSAWFPFTGDSVTFVAFANSQSNRLSIAIDGVWQTNFNVYNSTDITRTLSFDNLGVGPHVMQVRRYYNAAHVDAFVTPALEPGYTPPAYTGIARYESDHPAILYNGSPLSTMPQSWSTTLMPNASDSAVVGSTTLSDTISFTFEGRWLSIGVRSRSTGGYGEVFIDGVSYGIIDSLSAADDLRSFEFGDLITGTHTLEIVVLDAPNPLSNYVFLDYIDVWDGTPMPDDFANAHKALDSGRLHYSVSGVDAVHPEAILGDYLSAGLSNTNSNVWYSFTGDSFTFYGLSRSNTSTQEVYLDGDLIETVSLFYPYSEQPLVFHYSGFEDGPHTVRIHNISSMRVDGFASNPSAQSAFQPLVEWFESDQTAGASIWGGLHVPVAVGDVTGDGSVELVVASSNIQSNGELFLLRGDGGDTGDGDPIIWSVPYNIFNGFEDVAAPAIAELDGQPGAEIIHPTIEGLFVYHSDGSTYWFTDTVQSHVFFAAPAVGNLDFDPEPEIVINMNNDLVIFEPDGELAWLQTFPAGLSMPVLADLDGDGLLEILVHESGTTNIYAYKYNFGSPSLLWAQTAASTLHIYGGPAVADVDGQQPGGDPLPEVAIASEGFLQVLNGEDGSLVWSLPLDSGRSGAVSAADLDGDGEIELVTGMEFDGGRLYAVNADGTLLWSAPALDNSPLNASVMDLDHDGDYEVAFNGANQGLTLYNGADGAVLFNEPHPSVVSKTGSDFPLFADVDLDGYGELVVASQAGVRVFGFDGVWGPARPLWNQYSYHITNVNDNLSIPFNEPDSWAVHNTYRTQTSLVNPLPVYTIALTHTASTQGVTVLTDTFNIPPDSQSGSEYRWNFGVDWETSLITHTFNSGLSELLPGETRLVAEGTQASYSVSSGENHLALPPLYVSAAHIIAVDPAILSLGPGGSAEFSLALTNPTSLPAQFAISVGGLPGTWFSLDEQVSVAAGSSVVVPLQVSLPLDASAGSYPFIVAVNTNQGIADQSGAALVVTAPLVEAQIDPIERSAQIGEAAAYTLTVTNLENAARTYNLAGSGMAQVSLPAQLSVEANSQVSLPFSAQASFEGANPFTVLVSELSGLSGAAADASLTGLGQEQVEIALSPESASGGAGVPTPFEVLITNLGSQADIFDLSVMAPAGWDARLLLLGSDVSSVFVGTGQGSAVSLQLIVTPDGNAAPGADDITVTALSSSGAASDSASAELQVSQRGVLVEVISGPSQLEPDASGAWQVRVTNTGDLADTYDLSAFGSFAATAQLNPSLVTLAAGQSQVIQLSAGPVPYALPQEYSLGVLAQSQAETSIYSQDVTSVTILEKQALEIAWSPAAQTVNGVLTAYYSLVITNTGNVSTIVELTGSVTPAGEVQFEFPALELPARSTAAVLVMVDVFSAGVYQVNTVVSSELAEASASAELTVVYEGLLPAGLYMPFMLRDVSVFAGKE